MICHKRSGKENKKYHLNITYIHTWYSYSYVREASTPHHMVYISKPPNLYVFKIESRVSQHISMSVRDVGIF